MVPWLRSGRRLVADSLGLGEGVPLYVFIVCHVNCVCDYVFIYRHLSKVLFFSALFPFSNVPSVDQVMAYLACACSTP